MAAKLFHANGRTQPDGRTDRRDEANSRLSQVCERVYKTDIDILTCLLYRHEFQNRSIRTADRSMPNQNRPKLSVCAVL